MMTDLGIIGGVVYSPVAERSSYISMPSLTSGAFLFVMVLVVFMIYLFKRK
jgi:hypothetical protein